MFMRGDAVSSSVEGVPVTLNARRTIIDLGADSVTAFQIRDITYLPDEHRIGVGIINPHEIVLYGSAGVREGLVPLSSLGAAGPNITQYLPASRQFGVFLRGRPNRGLLRIIERDGTLTRTIDLRPYVVDFFSFAYFNPADPRGGQLLVLDAINDAMLVLDLDGNLISRSEYHNALDLPFAFGVTAITTGPYAGAFAALNADNSEVAILTLP